MLLYNVERVCSHLFILFPSFGCFKVNCTYRVRILGSKNYSTLFVFTVKITFPLRVGKIFIIDKRMKKLLTLYKVRVKMDVGKYRVLEP